MYSSLPALPVYRVYTLELIRYTRACTNYVNFQKSDIDLFIRLVIRDTGTCALSNLLKILVEDFKILYYRRLFRNDVTNSCRW